jgi:hypothetical protein
LQGAASDAGILNTNRSWKVIKCEGYTPVTVDLPSTAYSLGPGERIDMRHAYQGWNESGFDDEGWSRVEQIATGFPKNTINAGWGENDGWNLVPGSLPQMELRTERLRKVRLAEGVSVPDGFLSRPADLTVPSSSKAKLILDQTHQTNACLTLIFGKGRDARITVSYADCLYEKFPFRKGHRDIIEGKEFRGRTDEILSSGADRQEYAMLIYL